MSDKISDGGSMKQESHIPFCKHSHIYLQLKINPQYYTFVTFFWIFLMSFTKMKIIFAFCLKYLSTMATGNH